MNDDKKGINVSFEFFPKIILVSKFIECYSFILHAQLIILFQCKSKP